MALRCVTELKNALKNAVNLWPEARILGPAPAGVLRVNDRFRYRVMLSCKPSKEARMLISAALKQFSADKRYRDLVLYGDVDPLE